MKLEDLAYYYSMLESYFLYILPLNASNITLANTNNNSEIIEQFKRAIEINPSADLYKRFGGFLNSIKKYDDAIAQIKRH